MELAIKVSVSKNGNAYKTLGIIESNGSYRSLGFVKDWDVAYLLNLSAREVAQMSVGLYKIV